jgi:hypothetical protein
MTTSNFDFTLATQNAKALTKAGGCGYDLFATKRARGVVMAAALFGFQAAQAAVTSAFDGNWFDPSSAGQGFIFETFPNDKGELTLFAFHASYDEKGLPTFFIASGELTNRPMNLDLLQPTLGRQIAPGVFEAPRFLPVGKLALNFRDCAGATATVTFATKPSVLGDAPQSKVRVGTGSFRLQRLGASLQAKRCTGGVSDNTFPGEQAVGFEQFLTTPTFGARAVFEKRPDATEFRLEFRDLPVGSYQLTVADVPLRTFNAVPFGAGTKAEVKFRSPESVGFSTLLDFDAPGQQFLVRGTEPNTASVNDGFTLTDVLVPLGNTNATSPSSSPIRVNERFGAAQLRGLVSAPISGSSADLLLDTQFDRSPGLDEFKVSLEGADAGVFDVVVNGQRRGQITVATRQDKRAAGEVFFRSPVTVGSYPLDFDPRGAVLEIKRNGNLEYGVTLRK